MNQTKAIAQYELYSSKGEIPSRLSCWLEGVYRQFMLSDGAYVRLANIKVNQQVDLIENAEPGVTFSFMATQSFGGEVSHYESACPGCNRKKNQLAQATLLSQHLKGVGRLHANQHITCLQLYVPFTRLEQIAGLEGLNLKLPMFSVTDDGVPKAPQKELFSIHVDRQIALAINAIYKRGFDLLQHDVGQVQIFSEELLQRLVGQLQQRYVGPVVCKGAVSPHLYAGLSAFGNSSSLVVH